MVAALLLAACAAAQKLEVEAPGWSTSEIEQVRSAYIGILREDPEDWSGLAAADFLAASTTPIRAALLPDGEEHTVAIFRPSDGAIVLSYLALGLAGLSPGITQFEVGARIFARRTAHVLVHECFHAIRHRDVGDVPPLLEDELSAYAAQGLHLWSRLERDPEHLLLVETETRIRDMFSLASPHGRWWRSRWLGEIRPPDPSADWLERKQFHAWFPLRSLAFGVEWAPEAYRRAGFDWPSLPSAFSSPDARLGEALAALQATERELARVRATLASLPAPTPAPCEIDPFEPACDDVDPFAETDAREDGQRYQEPRLPDPETLGRFLSGEPRTWPRQSAPGSAEGTGAEPRSPFEPGLWDGAAGPGPETRDPDVLRRAESRLARRAARLRERAAFWRDPARQEKVRVFYRARLSEIRRRLEAWHGPPDGPGPASRP